MCQKERQNKCATYTSRRRYVRNYARRVFQGGDHSKKVIFKDLRYIFICGWISTYEILFFWEDEPPAIPAMGFDQATRDLTHSHVSGW